MKLMKKILLVLLVVIIAVQFIQPARNTNDRVLSTGISKVVLIPKNVDSILKVACYDCHSNHTNYPWYSYVQPVGWILHNHITNGKKQLNFSQFGSYPTRRQQSKLKAIADQVKDAEMPLKSYTFIHKNARLSGAEKTILINWARNASDNLDKINP